jgi:hypothetical protein
MTRLALAVAAILMLASSGAIAQEAQPPGTAPPEAQQPGGQQGWRRWYFACRPEAAEFCGQVRPGGGRIRLCLLHRFYKLPQVCRQALLLGAQQ